MDTKRIYKEKSKYKKKRKGFKGVPAWANKTKTDDDRVANDLSAETESPPHESLTFSIESSSRDNSGELTDISFKKLAGKEVSNSKCVDPPNTKKEQQKSTKSLLQGYKIIDANILQELFNSFSKCHHCGEVKCLSLFQKDSSRRGMSEKLYVKCLSCTKILKTLFTSKTTSEKLVDINLRSVHAAVSSGGGLTLLRTFCSSMDLPPPIHTAPYSKYLKVILKSAMEACDESMKYAAQNLSHNNLSPTEVAVSIDGTWQKCYGHNSLLGATFVISIQNGCVLDYSIKSKTCSVCKKNRNPSEEWKKSHEPFCQINHKGSSGSMEKEGAVEMFLQSIDKHNLKYTEYIGDGD